VAQYATKAINSLAGAASANERSSAFGALMDQFADLPAISTFVLGAYARPLRADPALKAQWTSAFRNYAMASYEAHFDKYRGSALHVTGSQDYQINGRPCSRVATQLTAKSAGPLAINWYLCDGPDGWKVGDVGVIKGTSELKLAITQRAEMVAFLGANGGDLPKLIARVMQQTAALKKS